MPSKRSQLTDDPQRRVAFVTGAGGGIGSAVVAALRGGGVHVAGFDAHEPEHADLALPGDVTDEQALSAAVGRTVANLGAIDFLVCAAGSTSEYPVVELSSEEWRRVVDSSMLGTFLATRTVLPGMLDRRRGRIVALSSGFATKGAAAGAHYAAAKAGVEAFVKSVALEVASSGITVNAVAPGPTETPMLDYVLERPGGRAALESVIPLGRIGTPADVAGSVLFLLGDSAAYVTGQVLHVNGGMLMP